jgi:DNA-binding transcriptional LysR family regulator
MLDWDDLRILLAVARHGSMSAAARVLEVAQPTVGRRLSALERKLGAKLLATTPTGRVLTATGRRMVQHAERMELDALAAERVSAGRDVGMKGSVSVTASEWMVQRLLALVVAPLLTKHPALEVELIADTRPLNLARREADLAVRPARFEHQEIIQREVAGLSFGLYASHAYLAQHGMPDFSAQCEGHTLIAMSQSLATIVDVDFLPKVAAAARVVARANGREPMMTLASVGVGLACLPRFLGDANATLRHLPTPVPAPRRSLWLGVHRDVRSVARVKAVAAQLAEGLGRLKGALEPVDSLGQLNA